MSEGRNNEGACLSLAQLEAFLHEDRDGPAVRQHLEACGACAGQLQALRDDDAVLDKIRLSGLSYDGELRDLEAPPRPGERAPESIEGYEILAELHRGAQGVVYRAVQSATKRTVALKVLLEGAFATSRQRRRFEREVDLVASLRHPSIVTVYDSGVTRSGRHWFAMEYVDGVTLRDHARGTGAGLPLPDLLGLFAKICAALQEAHQRGVIHRDLKPGNIMVDRSGEVHVVDFGLAKPINPQMTMGEAIMTREGAFMGTLAYASPEQIRGDADVRSDVYALGVILYELLTWQYPYRVDGPLSDVLSAIASAAPRPPRECRPVHYRIGRDLETVVLKALAKDPERRYQSAGALGRDIEHCRRGEAIDARRDSPWYVLRKTIARHKAPVAAAAVFLALLVGSTIVTWVLYERARRESHKLAQINIFLEDTLGSVEGRRGRSDVTVAEMLEEGEQWIDLVLAGQDEVESGVRTIIGNGYRNIERLENAERQLTRALELRRDRFGPDHPEVASSLNALGLVHLDQGRLKEAADAIEGALGIRRRHLGNGHIAVAYSLSNLARVRRASGDLAGAEELVRESLALRVALRGEHHQDVAMSRFELADLREARGAADDAIALHRQALALRRQLLPPAHPDMARSLVALGRILVASGSATEAEPLLRECVELYRQIRGEGHWRLAEARGALGECLAAQRRFAEAETELRAAHALLAEALGPDHRETRRILEALIALYEAWDRPDQAAAYRALRGGGER